MIGPHDKMLKLYRLTITNKINYNKLNKIK